MTDKSSSPSATYGEDSADATARMLPCPSCGETDVDAAFSLGEDPKTKERHVNAGCMVCGMMGPDSNTPKDAADRWNALPRRTSVASERGENYLVPADPSVDKGPAMVFPPSEMEQRNAETIRQIKILVDYDEFADNNTLLGKIHSLVEEIKTARSATRQNDTFLLEVCEELFGCHLGARHENGMYECSLCETMVHISGWVTAKHADDCLINRVRQYLAKHKPECTPGVSVEASHG